MKPHHVRQRPDAGHAKWGQGIGASLHIIISELLKSYIRNILGSSGVKNPPSNAGDMGSIPGQGTKILHATGQVSPQLESPWATMKT